MQHLWPVLSYEEGKDTFTTVHMWTQIVGKIKLSILPWVNHSWHVTLHITPNGLTTQTLPFKDSYFQIDFDFVHHQLRIFTGNGENRQFGLENISVAGFYKKIFENLDELGIDVKVNPVPSEVVAPIPFYKDETHHTYNAEQIKAFHTTLLKTQKVFYEFRSRFRGKCSPVHFFWGGFDLALSFFSGKVAPAHVGGIPGMPDWVAKEAYDREISSCGFWTGNEAYPHPAFYCYLYPEPEGYKTAKIFPPEAFYNKDLGEFILPYEIVQQSEEGDSLLLEFLSTTYNAGANLAHWNRDLLEF